MKCWFDQGMLQLCDDREDQERDEIKEKKGEEDAKTKADVFGHEIRALWR